MSTATVVVSIVSIVTGKVCVLIGLWLRLRWRTRHEQVQRRHLASVTGSIAEDGKVEIVEHRPDGHSIHIQVVRGQQRDAT
ncbi:hypothetical protein OG689_41220 [Kitasatospora sp. NBC_00240]|uniref:hypothetical protein n=1 Tax=Kitasatospora sp. NBC_00240 TaxID=2903567 RepID=UPI002258B653|nr:hypothetical protein [Kitasatospora sp. NBC_00240]MCX5215577.1 hypothetical protein [Kitasatospora sp. NBC_00240]